MPENLLVPLSEFTLPLDFPWRVGFVASVDDQLKRLRATGHYEPARFFGYYFQGSSVIGISGSWTVSLDSKTIWKKVTAGLEKLTCGQFSIQSDSPGVDPDFMLVHDRHNGACWLWRFDFGLRFVGAIEPVVGEQADGGAAEGDVGDRRLLEP